MFYLYSITIRIGKVKIFPTFSKVLQSIISDIPTTRNLIKFEMNIWNLSILYMQTANFIQGLNPFTIISTSL